MWVKFTTDFPWRQERRVIIAYRAGMVRNVTRACADLAIKAGAAEKCEPPARAGTEADRGGE